MSDRRVPPYGSGLLIRVSPRDATTEEAAALLERLVRARAAASSRPLHALRSRLSAMLAVASDGLLVEPPFVERFDVLAVAGSDVAEVTPPGARGFVPLEADLTQ